MGKAGKTKSKHIIVKSEGNMQKDKRYEVYDAYHDKCYIVYQDCRKIVVINDKGEDRVYRLNNDAGHELLVLHVDGGIFKDSVNKKCDFAVYTQERILILIELKGADYSQALDQLNATIIEMIEKPMIKVGRLHARVVLSKTKIPNILTSKEIAFKKRLKGYGGNLKRGTRQIEERLSDL